MKEKNSSSGAAQSNLPSSSAMYPSSDTFNTYIRLAIARYEPDPPPECLAGRSALPVDPGGTVDAVACLKTPRGKRQSQRSRPCMYSPAVAGSGAELVGGALAAGGRACQHRPARSLNPGRGGRTRLPPRELLAARLRPLWRGYRLARNR